jgi:hypothetical protein
MPDRHFSVPWKFICFSILFFMTVFIFEGINQRLWLNDFRVYYSAAQAFLDGQPVYGRPFGLASGYYKYSPFVLLFFTPASVLPFKAAAIIHFWVISFCSIACMLAGFTILSEYLNPAAGRYKNLVLSASFVVLMNHLTRELHLGNVNMILVLLLLLALLLLLENRQVASGVLFALALLFKPYLVLLALPLVFHGRYRMLITAAAAVAASALVLVPVSGFTGTLMLHREWIGAMMVHGQTMESRQTLEAMAGMLTGACSCGWIRYLILCIVVAAYALFFLASRNKRRAALFSSGSGDQLMIIGYFTLFAVIPNLVVTDTEHFLFTLPLVLLVTGYLFTQRNLLFMTLAVLFFLLYMGTSSDLMGAGLSHWLEERGSIGIGNLGIIALSVFVFTRLTEKSNFAP